ncbi:MAG: formate--tetrahydrofolate ligase, partial [Flavisolibacter sp.]
DLGAEKFFNIKCAMSGLQPEAVVIVATTRALRHHGGLKKEAVKLPNVEAVVQGLPNLVKHIENIQKYGLQPIVAINYFPNDSEEEIDAVMSCCELLGVKAVVSTAFIDGGEGSAVLAAEIVKIIEAKEHSFKPLYNWADSVEEKIHTIATQMYGAKEVEYSLKARQGLKQIKELGFEHMPVCMAKTPKSLSDDEKKLGRPENFVITVREFEFAAGAGFIIPVLGEVMRMPGLPASPAAENMEIDEAGKIHGLF